MSRMILEKKEVLTFILVNVLCEILSLNCSRVSHVLNVIGLSEVMVFEINLI